MILLSQLPLNVEQQNLNPNFELNLQAITLFSNERYFLLEPNYKKSLINSKLLIDRQTGTVEQVNENKLADTKTHYFSLFLGLLEIDGHQLLCLVEEALLICTIHRRDLFRITKPIFIFLQKGLKPNQSQNAQIRSIANIFKSGMYFSYSYNLTERMASDILSPSRDEQFNWIHHLQKPLKHLKARWLIPVIQGFVGKFEIYVQGKKLTMMLISRRSAKMAGTRYLSRGIDEQAEVANFVETQQVVLYENYAFSYVQVRGSVPLFWKQVDQYKGLVKDIEMLRDFNQNKQICWKHLEKLRQQYGEVAILNLLQQSKKSQAKLISSFEKVIKDLLTEHPNSFNYAYYDAKKGGSLNQKEENANVFIEYNLLSLIQKQKFDCFYIQPNTQSRRTLQSQKGIFRTNCLDCVQRTGRMQPRISALALLYCLKSLSINILQKQSVTQLQFFSNLSHPFAELFRKLWADNTDSISQQYTGTDSIHSHYSRTGKQTIIDPIDQGLKSIWRAVIDLGSYDVHKQKAISKILGTKDSTGATSTEELDKTERTLMEDKNFG